MPRESSTRKMPELPEVESTRRALEPELEGRRIVSVDVRHPRVVRRQARPVDLADRLTGSSLAGTTFGWAVIPTAPQGDPFDADNSFPGNGQILIGQFSTANGSDIVGTMLVSYVSNGLSGSQIVSFGIPSPGALAMLGVAGLIGTRRRRRG